MHHFEMSLIFSDEKLQQKNENFWNRQFTIDFQLSQENILPSGKPVF